MPLGQSGSVGIVTATGQRQPSSTTVVGTSRGTVAISSSRHTTSGKPLSRTTSTATGPDPEVYSAIASPG